jgi:hypothetical protein
MLLFGSYHEVCAHKKLNLWFIYVTFFRLQYLSIIYRTHVSYHWLICSFADNVELNLPDYLIFFLKRKRKRKVWAEMVELEFWHCCFIGFQTCKIKRVWWYVSGATVSDFSKYSCIEEYFLKNYVKLFKNTW